MKDLTKKIVERGERRLRSREANTPLWTDYQRLSFVKLCFEVEAIDLREEVVRLNAVIAVLRSQIIHSECADD